VNAKTRRIKPRAVIDAPRQVAYDALRLVDTQDAYLNLVLSDLLAEKALTGRDAAFATELSNGTARRQGAYLAILDSVVAQGTDSLQPEVRTALLMGAHQVLAMRVPAHAAVGTTVEIVRAAVGERPVRMVNAVVRRLSTRELDDWLAEVAPDRHDDLAGHLSVWHSHPRWVVQAFLDVLDTAEVEGLLVADNVAPQVSLVVRPGLTTVDELVAWGAQPGRWSPYAATLPGGDPGALADVRLGRAGVQDEGSQLAALALARAEIAGPDHRWLDLCAGPGGKAALLAGLARGSDAVLVASERIPHRARLVRNAMRAYPEPRPVLAADGVRPPWQASTFDRVIADVPCTGLGALRRRPEARWRRSIDDLAQLVVLQRRLLAAALDSVRPGGVVAYVTCSPHRDETRGVVDAVLAERGDVRQLEVGPLLPELSGTDTGPGPAVQLWPHRHGTDAMFIAVVQRIDR
jgi:16S rRNA (cytosine967-C5)-methyltransferase